MQLPPSALSPAEAALQQIASMEALEVLGKLHYNLAVLPKVRPWRLCLGPTTGPDSLSPAADRPPPPTPALLCSLTPPASALASAQEDKYRRIKLSNKKIQETIVDTAGVMDAMLA